MIKRFGNVIMIHLSDLDSNIYLIGDTVIDTGTGFNFTRLRDVLRMLNTGFEKVATIINTHGHFDHIGGNGYFLNAKILIHKHDAPIIEKADTELSVADFFDGKLHPKSVHKKLEDGDVVNAGGHQLEVIHTPGHTMGSICLYDRRNGFLFSGDTVFENAIGRVDFPNSDPAAMQDSLRKLEKLRVKTVFPGHGKPFDSKAFVKVVKTNVSVFQNKIEEGEVEEDYI